MLYLITFLGIFIAGILTSRYPFFGKAGTIFWLMSWFFIFLFFIRQLIEMIKLVVNKKIFVALTLILLTAAIVLINIDNPKNISGETTQEINCMLTHFKFEKDWGFNKSCFLGYPSRQFILPVLPSLIFGRSLFALNLGGAIYFIIGLIIFASGTLSFLGKNKVADLITAIILSFIFHLYYFNHFMFLYEQSIYPFCFSLLAVGLFLHYLSKKSWPILILIGFTCLFLIFAYTPGIAVYFLIVFVLLGFLYSKQINFYQKITIALIIIITLVSYLFSLKVRGDINFFDFNQPPAINILKDLTDTFYHLILQKNGNPMVSPVFNFIFLSVLFIPLFLVFGKTMFIGSIWMLAVIIASVIAKGYSYYGIDFRVHRATIIFPILFLMIILMIKPYIKKLDFFKKPLTGLLIFLVFTGLIFQLNMLNLRDPGRHLIFINFLKEKIKEGTLTYKEEIIFSDRLNSEYISLHDILQYFLPNFKYGSISDYLTKGINSENAVFFLTNDDLSNELLWQLVSRKQKIGVFNFKTDRTLLVFK
ncbi:MAG: hypothetical protein QHH09_02295 [Microgenomates group bacterium]|nr:hypothetical protein [Microgenomates group bacterium]